MPAEVMKNVVLDLVADKGAAEERAREAERRVGADKVSNLACIAWAFAEAVQ